MRALIWGIFGKTNQPFVFWGGEVFSRWMQSLPTAPRAGSCLQNAELGHHGAGWHRQCQGDPRAFPLTHISKCSAFVFGRDLEETHHPAGHSGEVLPAVHLTLLAANVLLPCCSTSSDCFCTLFNASCGFISITGKTWLYFRICLNFPSYCRAEGLPVLLASHTWKSNRSRVIPQQVDALTSPLNCYRHVSAVPLAFAPYLSPRQSTGGWGKGWWEQGLREAFHISPLPLSNAKIISLRRSCLTDGQAERFSVMAIGLIQFGSLKSTDSAISKICTLFDNS